MLTNKKYVENLKTLTNKLNESLLNNFWNI